SNGSTITIAGSCTSTYIVNLTGADAQTYTCVNSQFTFTVNLATGDGTYDYFVAQEEPTSGLLSSEVRITWIRDTSAPPAPTVLAPSLNPYRSGDGTLHLLGTCETDATVKVASEPSFSTTCENQYFDLAYSKSADATYNLGVVQVDRAGNVSSTATFTWIKDSSLPTAPVIVTPNQGHLVSSASSIQIVGSCLIGLEVVVSSGATTGEMIAPAGTLSTACSTGSFSFTIQKSGQAQYVFQLAHRASTGLLSGAASVIWSRDSLAPILSFNSTPPNPNLMSTATFTFSANESATFQCALDAAPYTSCTSPVTLTNVTTGSRSFHVRAYDAAGNSDSGTSNLTHNWTQSFR
ncbi:hypothetical protein E3A20_29780, partial [Planctomyces bekefii]